MKPLFFIIVSMFLLYSCNTHNKRDSFLQLSSRDTIFVKPEILETEKIHSIIWKIRIMDSLLVLLSDDGNGCLQIFKKANFEYLCTKGIYGRGPGEVSGSWIEFRATSDSINIYDVTKSSILICHIDDFLKDSTSSVKKNILFDNSKYPYNIDIIPLKGLFVSRPTIKARYALFNSEGKYLSDYLMFPEYYVNEYTDKYNYERGKYFHVEPKPDLSKFVSVTHVGGTIEIFSIKNDSIIKIVDKRYLNPDLNESTDKSLLQEETKIGFCGLCTTDNYIYASYSGLSNKEFINKKILADFIVVFNWNGQIKKLYKVEGGLRSLAVDEMDKKIYIITQDSEGLDVVGLINM